MSNYVCTRPLWCQQRPMPAKRGRHQPKPPRNLMFFIVNVLGVFWAFDGVTRLLTTKLVEWSGQTALHDTTATRTRRFIGHFRQPEERPAKAIYQRNLCIADSTGLSSFVLPLLPLKSAKSREILRKFELVALQGHPRSSILVPIERAYATSY